MSIVVMDMDGTLCHSPVPACLGELPRDEIMKLMDPARIAGLDPTPFFGEALANVHKSTDIVVVTARWEPLRSITSAWLRHHGLMPRAILMRQFGDRRASVEVKLEAAHFYLDEYGVAECWYDDDEEMLRRALAAGVTKWTRLIKAT